jgi:DNA-binding response OmpR family regulator
MQPPPRAGQTPTILVVDDDARFRRIPLIVLTARAGAGDAVRSLEAGADDVLTKPFAPEEMLARVRGKIKRAAQDAALQRDTRVPYRTVSIAVLNGSRGATSYERIGERAALVKKEAKRRRGSVVVTEQELSR